MSVGARTALAAIAILTLAGCGSLATRAAVTSRLDAAIAGTHRTAAEPERDVYRHPRDTLLFFGLRPDYTVVEVMPIGGWYTKIIAPVVRTHGRYIAAMPPATAGNANSENSRQAYLSILASAPGLLDKVEV